MNDLQVVVSQQAGIISFNFEEIKENITDMVRAYEGATFHEDTVIAAKGEVATLRKIQKAIDAKRIEVKKECLKPYDAFEVQAKELVALIEEPVLLINKQVAAFEEAARLKKKAEIQKAYDEAIGDMKEYLPLEKIYDPKWENVSVKIKSVSEAIETLVTTASLAVATIKERRSEAEAKALAQYKADLNLSNAMSCINQYESQKIEILAREEARRKADEERKAEEERERIRREERQRIEAEERIRAEERAKLEIKEPVKEIAEPKLAEDDSEEPFAVVEEKPFEVGRSWFTYEIYSSSSEIGSVDMYLDSVGLQYRRK